MLRERKHPRRASLVVLAALCLSSWGCRPKDRQDPKPEAAEVPPPPPTIESREVKPWFVGTFRAEVPLVRLPPAPERRAAKIKDTADPGLEAPPLRAALVVRIDAEGSAHIELTQPFPQATKTTLADDELRARFIPTSELLGSGTVLLRRSGDTFSGTLSLLDPDRTTPLAGRVEAKSLRREP